MEIQELRVKISADMMDFSKALNIVKRDLGSLTSTSKLTEKSIQNMNKSATLSSKQSISANQKLIQSNKLIRDSVADIIKQFQGLNQTTRNINPLNNTLDLKPIRTDLAKAKKDLEEFEQIAEQWRGQIQADLANGVKLDDNELGDFSEFIGQMESLKQRITEMNAALDGTNGKSIIQTTEKIEDLKLEAQKTKEELEAAKLVMQYSKVDFGSKEFQDASDNIANLSNKYYKLQNDIKLAQNALEEMMRMTKSLEPELSNFKNAIDKFGVGFDSKNFGQMISSIGPVISTFGSLCDKAFNNIVIKAREAADKVKAYFTSTLGGQILSGVGKLGYKAGSLIASGMVKGVSAIAKMTSAVSGLMSRMNPLTGIANKLSGTFKRLGSRIKRAFTFSVVYSGFNKLKEKVGEWLNSNEQIKSSLATLKGAWTTALAPLVNAFIPALQRACSWATSLAATVAKLIALLTGQSVSTFKATAEGMENAAKASDDMASSAGGAGDAAKEAQKELAGFDELEVMSDKSQSGGGGSSASAADTSFLDDLADSKFNSWGEAFSSLLDRIIGKLPVLDDLLQRLAKGFNDFTKNLLEMFTFPGVLEKVSTIATELANIMNRFLDAIDWNQMGQAIGAGLNLVFQFMKDFLYNFDWKGLGSHIAEAFNGMFDQINFENVGALLVSKFNMVWETIQGFVTTLDWNKVGLAISDTINGMIKSIDLNALAISLTEGVKGIAEALTTAIQNIDFEALKNKIHDFFTNLDIAGMVNAVIELAAAAIKEGIPLVLDTLHEVLQKLTDTFKNINWGELGTIIAEGLNKIIGDLPNLITDLMNSANSLLDGLLNTLCKLVSDLDWGRLVSSVITSIGNILGNLPIDSILNAITSIILSIIQHIPDIILGAVQGIVNILAQIFRALGMDCVAGLLEGFSGWLDKAITAVTDFMKKIVDAVKNFLGIHSPSTVFAGIGNNLVDGLLQGIKNTWNTITTFFSSKFNALKKTCSDTWNNIKSTATTAWTNIKTTISSKVDETKTKVTNGWNTLKTNVTNTTNMIKSNLTTTWENMKSTIQSKTTSLKSTVESNFNTFKSNVSNTVSLLRNALNADFENMRSTGTLKFTNLKSTVENLASTLRTNVGTYFDNMKSNMENKISTAKTNCVNTFTNLKTSVVNICNGLLSSVKSIFSSISSWVTKIWNKVSEARSARDDVDDDGGYVNSGPGVKKMARGGVVTSPTLSWVGEYPGASSNPEIVTPESLLTNIFNNSQDMVVQALLQTTRQIIGAIEDKDMDVRIDDNTIAASVVRADMAARRRTGQSLLTY